MNPFVLVWLIILGLGAVAAAVLLALLLHDRHRDKRYPSNEVEETLTRNDLAWSRRTSRRFQ